LAQDEERALAHRRSRGSATVPEPSVDTVVLVSALRQLPESQRRALVLFHLCDRSIEEIADDTGAPIGTVKARLARGRTALAQLLEDNPEHPPRRKSHV